MFDGLFLSSEPIAHLRQQDELALLRRERATTLWRSLDEQQMDLRYWVHRRDMFGPLTGHRRTIACALGWLAIKRVDGWGFTVGIPTRGAAFGFDAACGYFGIGFSDAVRLFSLPVMAVRTPNQIAAVTRGLREAALDPALVVA